MGGRESLGKFDPQLVRVVLGGVFFGAIQTPFLSWVTDLKKSQRVLGSA